MGGQVVSARDAATGESAHMRFILLVLMSVRMHRSELCLSVCLSVRPSVCLSVCLCFCLSAYISIINLSPYIRPSNFPSVSASTLCTRSLILHGPPCAHAS